MTPHICIATPYRGAELRAGTVSLGYHQFTLALEREMGATGLDATLMVACDVVRARNRAVGHVLRDLPGITHVLWLDDDTFPEDVDDGIRVIREMLALGEHMVSWPYTTKSQPLRWVHQHLDGGIVVDERGCIAVRGVGFGFTLTSAEMLRRMAEDAVRYGNTYWDLPKPHDIANLFGQMIDTAPDGRRFLGSEDFSFCKRWRDLGGTVQLYVKGGVLMHAGGHCWSAREMPGGVVG